MKQYLSNLIDDEKNNILFWLLFSYVLGIALYFSLSSEPTVKFILVFILIIFVICRFLVQNIIIRTIIICFLLGITIPYIKTQIISTEFVADEPSLYKLSGEITSILPGSKGVILVLDNIKFSDEATPYKKVRVNVRTYIGKAKVGDIVSLKAMLYRPSNPIIIGGYDFARKAYFENISAVGYALSYLKIIEAKQAGSLEQIRYDITKQLVDELGNSYGGIATGLIVGEYSFIDKKLLEQIRSSGLAHLLSVSGMHISIVALMFFLLFRKVSLLFGKLY